MSDTMQSLGDLMAQVVRETVTVGTRTGKETHAAVHNNRLTFCGANTSSMMEFAEGWDGVTCARCLKRVEKNVASAMKHNA